MAAFICAFKSKATWRKIAYRTINAEQNRSPASKTPRRAARNSHLGDSYSHSAPYRFANINRTCRALLLIAIVSPRRNRATIASASARREASASARVPIPPPPSTAPRCSHPLPEASSAGPPGPSAPVSEPPEAQQAQDANASCSPPPEARPANQPARPHRQQVATDPPP